MDAGFGAQPAEGVVSPHMDRGALESCHVAAGNLDERGFETLVLGPAQVHAQHHLGPVLGFGAAGARLDIEVGVGLIHLAGEHAPEFQGFEFLQQRRKLGVGFAQQFLVTFVTGKFEPLAQLPRPCVELIDGGYRGGEFRLFAAQGLGPGGLFPDRRLGEFKLDLGEPLTLGGIVKDTP